MEDSMTRMLHDVPLVQGIARVCHEANRAYCQVIGDDSQRSWSDAEPWQRESAMKGVEFALSGESTPREQHEAWMADKVAAGWVYGTVKDAEQKTHPCLVPYHDLPVEQQKKDALFRAIVLALKD